METIKEEKNIEIVEKIKAFVLQEVQPYALEFDRQEALSERMIKKMAETGILGATIPEEFGGLALDPLTYGKATEAIGKVCPGTRSLLTVHNSLVSESIVRWGTDDQKEKYLPQLATGKMIGAFCLSEPNIGSDAQNIETYYKPIDGGFCLNGVKKWITMGARADLFVVIARDQADERVSAFLVESNASGISRKQMKGLMAGRSSFTGEIHFDEVIVPTDNLLANQGGGFTYVVNTALDHGRYSIAWGALALAQAALEEMVKYARKRKQFGVRIYNHQLIQAMIADAAIAIEAGRALCEKVAAMRAENHREAVIQTTIAKQFNATMATKVCANGVQLHGANGLSPDFAIERLFREARVFEIIEGTTQVLQQMIADHGLIHYYKK